MIRILTGPTGSGKTTRLENWVKKNKNIAGILMPVLEGERYLYSIRSDILVPVEVHDERSFDRIIKIGKFNFSGKVFDWGNNEIIAGFEENKIIVIDEIGPLELNGKGFATALNRLLKNKNRMNEIDLILVVREGLVEQVSDFFNFSEFALISSPNGVKTI